MAKISKKSTVPTKMYRHFAVVTVLLTASLAMFADGENREYYAEQDNAQQRQSAENSPWVESEQEDEDREENTPAYGQAQLVRRDGSQAVGSFGSENDPSSYGRASGPGARRISSQLLPAENSENAGFTAAYLDKLSEDELDRLLAALEEDGIENEAERRQAIAILEAGSLRRSGHNVNVL